MHPTLVLAASKGSDTVYLRKSEVGLRDCALQLVRYRKQCRMLEKTR